MRFSPNCSGWREPASRNLVDPDIKTSEQHQRNQQQQRKLLQQKQQQQNAASSSCLDGMAQYANLAVQNHHALGGWSQNCNAVLMIFLRLRKIEKDEIFQQKYPILYNKLINEI